MDSEICVVNNKPRIGTIYLAKGFGRNHRSMLQTVNDYMDAYLSLDTIESRLMPRIGMGRPARDILLSKSQVMLLASTIRTTEQTLKFKVQVIRLFSNKDHEMSGIKELIDDFDFGQVEDMFVYAVKDEQGRIKIGISKNPENRVRNLNIGNADKLELVYTKKSNGGGYSSEVEAHKRAKQHRIHGEWFEKGAIETLSGKSEIIKQIAEIE